MLLGQKQNRTMRAEFFLDLWDEYFRRQDALRQFDTAVEWGRYAELFEYDAAPVVSALEACQHRLCR